MRLIFAALLALQASLGFAETREWTSADGRKIIAELVSSQDGQVTLRRDDGKTFTIGTAALSKADADFVATWKGRPLIPITVSVTVNMEQVDRNSTHWRTTWGSYEKSGEFARVLHVNAKTTDGAADPNTVIKYAFVGVDQPSNSMVVYDSGQAPFKVLRASGYSDTFVSLVKTNYDLKLALAGERYKSGVKPTGWAVFIEQNENEVHASGSTPDVLRHVRQLIQRGQLVFRNRPSE
jgi:hypothetical protein